ncbi:MAG: hypothetical protein MJ252_05930 [archaeon]|nr:hypothetical protein [archaeon]
MFYSIYDEKSSLSSEISKDYEKFSNVDIEVGSPRSNSSNSIISLKELLNESLSEYINTINIPYKNFKSNHYSQLKIKDKFFPNSSESQKVQNTLQVPENSENMIYKTNKKILNNIDNCYLVDKDKFKLKNDIFGMKRTELEKQWMLLIKKSDYVEVELNKVLSHSLKIQKYINDHFYSLKDNVNEVYQKIIDMKTYQQDFKKKYIENSNKILIKGIHKRNIKKIYSYMKTLKKLKDILDLLKILAPNKNKSKITMDLIDKAREMIERFKLNKKENSQIISLFENNLSIYVNKLFEIKNEDFSNALKGFFKSFLSFSEKETNIASYISEDFQHKLKESSKNINYVISYVSFDNMNSTEIIVNLIKFYIRFEVLTTFYTKIRGLLTQISTEVFRDIISKINEKINEGAEEEKESDDKSEGKVIGDKEKNEQCILFCLIAAKEKMNQSVEKILKDILSQIQNDPLTQGKKYEIIKKNFADEFNEIQEAIKVNISNIINNQIIKCLNEALNHTRLISFLDNFYLTRAIVGKENEFNDLFLKCQKEFIVNWTNSKLLKLNTNIYQSWEQINEIPHNYQIFVNIFQNNEINKVHIVGKNKEDYYKNYDTVKNYFSKKEGNIPQEEMKNYIQFMDKKFRCNQCMLDIILYSYEVIKLFSFFDFRTWENLLYSYSKLLSSFAIYQNDQIIKGKNSIVSQTEISMTYSIVRLIKEYRTKLAKSDSFSIIKKNVSETCLESFYSLVDNLDTISLAAKNKMNNLIEIYCIESTLNELEKIKLPFYNVVEGDTPVNEYALGLIKLMRTIYDSMIDCFEDDFIKSIITSNLKKFFEKFELFVFKGQKIEDENCLKQFRRDMIFLKKNFASLSLIDPHEYKNRIDNINKKVLPESMLKNKK